MKLFYIPPDAKSLTPPLSDIEGGVACIIKASGRLNAFGIFCKEVKKKYGIDVGFPNISPRDIRQLDVNSAEGLLWMNHD